MAIKHELTYSLAILTFLFLVIGIQIKYFPHFVINNQAVEIQRLVQDKLIKVHELFFLIADWETDWLEYWMSPALLK